MSSRERLYIYVYIPPSPHFLARRHFSGEGGGTYLFYTPPTPRFPRRVFSGAGAGVCIKFGLACLSQKARCTGRKISRAVSSQGSREVCLSKCPKPQNAQHFAIRGMLLLETPELRPERYRKQPQPSRVVYTLNQIGSSKSQGL